MTPRARALLAGASAANLLHNLLFPVLAVRALGAGAAADALFMVFVLPGVVMVLLGNSVLNWATPRLVRHADAAARRALAWSLLWVLFGAVALLCALLWAGAQRVMPHLAPDGGYALAVSVLPLGLLAMLATVFTAVAQSLYTAERDVPGGEWRTLLANLATALAWLALDPRTLVACAGLFAFRAVLGALLLAPRLGPPRRARLGDPEVRGIFRESRVLLLAATYYKSEPFVDRVLFASAAGGAVAAFHLAQQLLAVVTLMMNRLVTAPLVAPLAERVHAADVAQARRLLHGALARMAVVGVSVWLLFVFAGDALVRLLFAGSGESPEQLALTAQVLALVGGYMLAVLFGQVLAQVFYCAGETRRIVVLGVAGYTLGIVLKVLALRQFGVTGLAAAISLSWLINAAAYWLAVPGVFRRVAAGSGSAARTLPPV